MNCLRFLVLAALVTCCTAVAYADIVWPLLDGTPIYQSQLGYEEPRIAASADGVSLVVWGDESGGNRDIRGQMIDANQQLLWPENGIALVELEEFQNAVDVIHVQDGWILLWLDRRFYQDELDWGPQYNLDMFIQKFNDNGEPQWHDEEQPPANGVHVVSGDFPSVEYHIKLLPDGNGGAYVVYVLYDPAESTSIPIGQHVLSDGSFAWTDYGVDLLGPEGSSLPRITDLRAFNADDGDGFFAAWVSRPIMDEPYAQAQRVLADGTLWDYTTAPIIGEPVVEPLTDLSLCSDGAGGAFVLWSTYANGTYAQRVAADGTLPWNDLTGQPISAAGEVANWTMLVPSANNTAIGYWRESNDFSPIAQRFGGETDLETFWGDGVPVGTQYDYMISSVPDGEGGTVVIAGDYTQEQRLTHLDVNGDIAFQTTFLPEDAVSFYFSMSRAGNDRAVFTHNYMYGQNLIKYHSYDMVNHIIETPDDGLSMNNGESGSAQNPSLALLDGTPYWAWADYRTQPFGRMLVMQSLDPLTGEHAFGQWGLPLLPGFPFTGDDPLTVYIDDVFCTAAGDEHLIVAGTISTYGDNEYEGAILQKVTPEGQLQWGDLGVFFDPLAFFYARTDFVTGMDDGGCTVLFSYYDSDWFECIGAQRFNSEGEPQWSDGDFDFIPLSLDVENNDDRLISVDVLADGSMMLLSKQGWMGEFYLKRVSATGELLWSGINPIADNDFSDPATLVVNGNLLTCFKYSTVGDPDGAIYGQMISPDGALMWGDAPIELIDVTNGTHCQDELQLQPCGDNAFWLTYATWGDLGRILVQQFDFSGIPLLFPLTGAELTESVSYITLDPNSSLVLPDNSLYVAWFKYIDYDAMIAYRRITQQGTFPVQYLDGPLAIADSKFWVNDLALYPDGDGGAYAYWQDWGEDILPESTGSLWAQRLNDGFMGVSEPWPNTPDSWTLHAAYPNPFNASTAIKVDLPQRTHLKAQVYDILGREVMTLADKSFNPGRHTLTVDANKLASGMYFLRVNQHGGLTKLQKLVLLK